MANKILTPDMITSEAQRILENSLVVTRNVNKQYDNSFAKEGAKIGTKLRVRLPDRVLVSDGAPLQLQDVNQQYTNITVSSQKQVALDFTSAELTMNIDDFSKLIIEPRVSQLAASIDQDVARAYKYIGNSVGTPGTTPATPQVMLAANQKLDESAAPGNSRYLTVNPAANAALVIGMTGLFNPSGTVSKQFKNGSMGEGILGFDEVAMSQSIGQYTTGTRNAAGTVNGTIATQGVTTIVLAGMGASKTIKLGEVFTIAAVNAVNPQTRESTGSLFQFVVLADTQSDGAGAATVTVAEIYDQTQALATVDVLPQTGAVVTFLGAAGGTYPQNLAYHSDCIAFASADLVLPKGVDMASRIVHNGISMRLVRDYDINQDRLITRLDVLYGWAVIRPELGVRMWG